MGRRTSRRLTSIFLLLAFLGVGTAEAFAVRKCPHHDLPRESVAGDAASSHDDGHRSGSVSTTADEDAAGGPADTDHPCNCVGTCHAAADAPLGSPGSAARGLGDGTALRAPSPPVASPLVPSPAYLLPYPNGPPLSA